MTNFVEKLKDSRSFYSGKGVSLEAIKLAEEKLCLQFSDEYKKYLLLYGIASIYGHEFTGLGVNGSLNVIDATNYERSKNSGVPSDYYVVEELHIDDIVIWQNHSGDVFQSYADGTWEKKSRSLYDFILEDSEDESIVVKQNKDSSSETNRSKEKHF